MIITSKVKDGNIFVKLILNSAMRFGIAAGLVLL